MAEGRGWQASEPGHPPRGGGEALRVRLVELRAVAMDLGVREVLEVGQAAEIIDLANIIEARFATGASSSKATLLAGLIESLTRSLLARDLSTEPEPAPARSRAPELEAASGRRPARPVVLAAMAASSVCAVLSLVAAGVWSLSGAGRSEDVSAPPAVPASARTQMSARAPAVAAPPAPPPVSGRMETARGRTAAEAPRGASTPLARLTALAQAGDPNAQLRLAALYETGAYGVSPDLEAARGWTLRAAQSGDRLAMYNIALFLTKGEGGPRDPAAAVAWFRRAAQQGVVDAQYNLGRVYEEGRGVGRNLREAYRWYAIAAQAGDLAARERTIELEPRLTPGERNALDRAVAAFEPGRRAETDDAPVIAPATTVAETQALLARQGYYVGPIDGLTSPALASAARAYLAAQPAGRPPA